MSNIPSPCQCQNSSAINITTALDSFVCIPTFELSTFQRPWNNGRKPRRSPRENHLNAVPKKTGIREPGTPILMRSHGRVKNKSKPRDSSDLYGGLFILPSNSLPCGLDMSYGCLKGWELTQDCFFFLHVLKWRQRSSGICMKTTC